MELSPERAIQALEKKDKEFLRYIASVEVTSNEEQKNCEDLLIIGRAIYKVAEEKRKEMLEPIQAAERLVNAAFKPYLSRLQLGIDICNKALRNWHFEQSKLADAARIEQMKAQAEQLAAARETGEIIQLPTVEVPIVGKTSHAHLGTVTYRKDFDIQVVNPDLVPRDLCEPSLPKIRARVKSGIMEIPGVLVSEKTITIARSG